MEELSPLQRAFYTIQKLKNQLADRSGRAMPEPVAVIGMSCRFPDGVSSPAALWETLLEGKNGISEIPPLRWQSDAWYGGSEPAPGKMSSKWGGFCKHVEQFDPGFFGITPRETYHLDPQQRLLLMVAWEAIENAGIPVKSLSGSETGVFIGCSANDYFQTLLKTLSPEEIGPYIGAGNSLSGASGRLSYQFGFSGPSLTIDTACSSSLVAVHTACQNLREGACSLAIAGGVNLIFSPELQTSLSQAGMLSPDGQCKTFDAAANGYVRAEGCGLVLLKPLSHALADGDPVLAVIRGSAVLQDGASGGLTVPSRAAQEKLIRKALKSADRTTLDLDFVEAHGTGTPLGDPIEVDAWGSLLAADSRTEPLPIGSIKTNFGHAEAAAGIAGLMKTILSLQHKTLPAHLHLETPNPHIDWEQNPLEINTQTRKLVPGQGALTAGVSSFGFTGTLAHLILEEAPAIEAQEMATELPSHLLKISAKIPEALRDLVHAWKAELQAPRFSLQAYCQAAAIGRQDEECRAAFVGSDFEEIIRQLKNWKANSSEKTAQKKRKIAFLFTGQGAQYTGMAQELYMHSARFRETMDACDALFQQFGDGRSLVSLIFEEAGSKLLHQTRYTQPALFAVGLSLYSLWRDWGIRPEAVMGHSIGEYIAATAAGIFKLEDAMKIVMERGRLMQSLPEIGAMASILAAEEQVLPWLNGHEEEVSIAAVNGSNQTVISGVTETVNSIVEKAKTAGIKAISLRVSHAFHSPLMAPILAPFEEYVGQSNLLAPQIRIFSNVSGDWLTANQARSAAYWRDHIAAPVRFLDGIRALRAEGFTHYVELGPGNTLANLAQAEIGAEATILTALHKGKPDWQQLLGSLAQLYSDGFHINWKAVLGQQSSGFVPIPNYPFQLDSYWIDPERSLPFQKTKQLQAMLYQRQWEPHSIEAEPQGTAGTYLILGEGNGIASQLAEALKNEGNAVQVLPFLQFSNDKLEEWRKNSAAYTDKVMVHFWAMEQDQQGAMAQSLTLLQQLSETSTGLRLLLCTESAIAYNSQATVNPLQAKFHGLLNVLLQENPSLQAQWLDLPTEMNAGHHQKMQTVLRSKPDETRLLIRGTQILKARIRRSETEKSTKIKENEKIAINSEGSYLITGGSGALGKQVLGWLARDGATELIILAYSQPDPAFLNVLKKHEKSGVRVKYVRVDLRDADALELTLRSIDQAHAPVKGIFHLAGRLRDRLIPNLQAEDLDVVLQPKLDAAWNLHRLSQELAWELDHFVLFSSVSAFIGTPGQAAYAAANAGLDAIAQHRRSQGLPALSIQWGPWAEAGMAIENGTPSHFSRYGIQPMAAETGCDLLEMALQSDHAVIAAFDVNWKAFSGLVQGSASEGFYEAMLVGYDPLASASLRFLEQFSGAYESEKRSLLSEFIDLVLRQTLGHTGTTRLDPEKPLTEQGFDSMLAVRFAQRINQLLSLEVAPTVIFMHHSIPSLSSFIFQELTATEAQAAPVTEAESSPISNENVSDLLAAELKELI